MSCTVAAKKGKHKGEAGGQWKSSRAQRGRCWVYFGKKVKLPSEKLQRAFEPNPLYLSSLRAELSAP